MSLSARRAWIEIAITVAFIMCLLKSLSARRAWIEMTNSKNRKRRSKKSLSARRAWIEMVRDITGTSEGHVALRKESVDRNLQV